MHKPPPNTILSVAEDLHSLLALSAPEWIDDVRAFISRKGFHVNPPLVLADLLAWEHLYAVKLPLDYCLFLLLIGNGFRDKKKVPILESLPLGSKLTASSQDEIQATTALLTQPFPLKEDIYLGFDPEDAEQIELSQEEIDSCHDSEDELEELKETKALSQFDKVVAETEQWLDQGTLAIGYSGPGTFYLVVTGEQRGNVWQYEIEGGQGSLSHTFQSLGPFSAWLAGGPYLEACGLLAAFPPPTS